MNDDKDIYERITDDIERVAKNYGKNPEVVKRKTYRRVGDFEYSFVKRAFGSWPKAVNNSDVYTESTWSDSKDRVFRHLKEIYREYGSLSHSVLEEESYTCTGTILNKYGKDNETWTEYRQREGLPT